jgi:hypothetical protein
MFAAVTTGLIVRIGLLALGAESVNEVMFAAVTTGLIVRIGFAALGTLAVNEVVLAILIGVIVRIGLSAPLALSVLVVVVGFRDSFGIAVTAIATGIGRVSCSRAGGVFSYRVEGVIASGVVIGIYRITLGALAIDIVVLALLVGLVVGIGFTAI